MPTSSGINLKSKLWPNINILFFTLSLFAYYFQQLVVLVRSSKEESFTQSHWAFWEVPGETNSNKTNMSFFYGPDK